MCVRRKEGGRLGVIAHMMMEEMKEVRQRQGAVFVLAVGDLKPDRAAVYISLLCSPLEAQVCVAAQSVGSSAPDD